MTKTDLFRETAAALGMKQADVKRVIEHAMSLVSDSVVDGEDVALSGFGTFRRKVVPAKPARMGRNPATGEAMKLKAKPASSKITFHVAKAWKDRL